ncbi:MAG: hypothetical protein WDN08_12370 [Rhizomicrobium sp.]
MASQMRPSSIIPSAASKGSSSTSMSSLSSAMPPLGSAHLRLICEILPRPAAQDHPPAREQFAVFLFTPHYRRQSLGLEFFEGQRDDEPMTSTLFDQRGNLIGVVIASTSSLGSGLHSSMLPQENAKRCRRFA